MNNESSIPSFWTALVAGGMAGTAVDVALFPIDTLKTRMQSPQGFWASGGLRGIYNGLGAAAAGSAPGAALFFCSYEGMKPITSDYLERMGWSDQPALGHMIAASVGEAAACLVRVPTEIVKAKMQTAETKIGLMETIQLVLRERHGTWLASITGGLYRGYGITLFREVPFAVIQFPLYEKFKIWWGDRQGSPVNPVQAAACGSISGAFAGAVTTPLDVLKTRLMLGVDKEGRIYTGVIDVLNRTVEKDGRMALLSGIQPRVLWISIGGFVFFGAYEASKKVVAPILG